jgi:hypothetical protein
VGNRGQKPPKLKERYEVKSSDDTETNESIRQITTCTEPPKIEKIEKFNFILTTVLSLIFFDAK